MLHVCNTIAYFKLLYLRVKYTLIKIHVFIIALDTSNVLKTKMATNICFTKAKDILKIQYHYTEFTSELSI